MPRHVLRTIRRVYATPLSFAVVVFVGETVPTYAYVALSASLLAVAGWLVYCVLAFCSRRIAVAGRRRAWVWRLGVGLAALVPAFRFGSALASGRGITASGWRPIVIVAVVVCLVGGASVLVESLARAWQWRARRRVFAAAACVVTAGATIAVTTFHATTYLRVHRGFLLLASILLQAGFEFAFRVNAPRSEGTRTAAALGTASVALLVGTSYLLSLGGGAVRPSVGLTVFSRTVIAQKLTALLFVLSPIYPRTLVTAGPAWLKGTRLESSNPPVVKPLPRGKYGRYNVIFMSADAFRADVVFSEGVANFSHTEQSLLSLQSGKWELGLAGKTRTEARRQRGLDRSRLPEAFARSGYLTIANMMGGRWGSSFFDTRHVPGFELHVQRGATCDEQIRSWESFLGGYDKKRPFFLWMHVFDTHRSAPHRDKSKSDQGARQIFEAAVQKVDACVGSMIASLEKSGLWDKTVFVFFADHGEALGEHGRTRRHSTCYWHDIHIPVMFRVPGLAPRRVAYRIQLSDLLPTIANLVGLNVGSQAPQGDDLSGLLGRRSGRGPRGVAFSAGHPEQYPCASILSQSWHLIYTAHAGVYELYDVDRDPAETHSLISSHSQVFALLRPLLDAYASSVAVGTTAAGGADPNLSE
jgi:hypothetical protein